MQNVMTFYKTLLYVVISEKNRYRVAALDNLKVFRFDFGLKISVICLEIFRKNALNLHKASVNNVHRVHAEVKRCR